MDGDSVFNENLLNEKKKRFLDGVLRASRAIGISPPHVEFWDDDCPYSSGDEWAHCHYETAIICVSKKRLLEMNFDDIDLTASHEVTHLTDKKEELGEIHSSDFYHRHDAISVASWRPPGGTIGVGKPDHYREKSPEELKPTILKDKCNRYGCNSTDALVYCRHCKRQFCGEHRKPFEPQTGFSEAQVGHPCPDLIEYLERVKKQQDDLYGEALWNMLGSKYGSKYSCESTLDDGEIDFAPKPLMKKKAIRRMVEREPDIEFSTEVPRPAQVKRTLEAESISACKDRVSLVISLRSVIWPIHGAKVHLLSKWGRYRQKTDPQGICAFNNLRPGRYVLDIQNKSSQVSKEIDIRKSQQIEIRVIFGILTLKMKKI